ncbi:hypothetical protein [Acinetobacter pittii]|uniref:hypothetical protein n=1 Tax=Acinetobacter pittii TaxID=48296 RepID=UPI00397E3A14
MKSNIKEIEKYIGYYLLVYICILMICGFFQYMTVCQGKSLECNFSLEGINKILTTTATILTPIIAIIGFLSWRNQETYKKSQQLIELILDKTRDLQISWHKSREHDGFSIFQQYCLRKLIEPNYTENLEIFQKIVKKNEKNILIFSELMFLIDKLFHEVNLNFSKLDEIIENVGSTLEKNIEDLYEFQLQLDQNKYSDDLLLKKSEIEMRQICDKLDSYCNHFMGRKREETKHDYTKEINDTISKISREVIRLKKEI